MFICANDYECMSDQYDNSLFINNVIPTNINILVNNNPHQ